MKLSVFWYRRDLRLEDNTALFEALQGKNPVMPIFIFDTNILQNLPVDDARVSFIYQKLKDLNQKLITYGSALKVLHGDPQKVLQDLIALHPVQEIFINKDYEPYGIERDKKIKNLLTIKDIALNAYKDQVIFEETEIVKGDGSPYTVFTPYKNKWLDRFNPNPINKTLSANYKNFFAFTSVFPRLQDIGFKESEQKVRDYDLAQLDNYENDRNIPEKDNTSYLSTHLRFGTVSIRSIIAGLTAHSEVFLSELIWREFFMQILWHFPQVVTQNFKAKYDGIQWRNNEQEFKLWCAGETGYPFVDAGMRQLNETGFMHNRVRMITAGFLCKHLLIDWRWGEAYFAEKLHDYELSSNNGNWQWAAGTGCDAAPYFRIFNPHTQLKKFDAHLNYVKKWIPDYQPDNYTKPIVEHSFARQRALIKYKEGMLD